MKKIYIIIFILVAVSAFSQTGTNFWFAPPNITDDYNSGENTNVFVNITAYSSPAVVTISIPASGISFNINVAANSNVKQDLSAYIASLETKPTNNILNTGLHIQSDNPISAFYEYNNSDNQEIFSLKADNALGQEFYIPLQNNTNNTNLVYTDKAYASFDIVATEDGTTVNIYPQKDIDGHTGQTQFSITLNKGQTYSGGWTGANYTQTSTHPQGSVVTSDKPIAITIKDDAVTHSSDGTNGDLLGDQIIPVDDIGTEYIVVKGPLATTAEESFYILSTQNATDIYINGNATPVVTLFRGETYRYDISASGNYTYVESSKPVYVTHVTGVGAEMAQAILPTLNCTGSDEVSFVRSSSEDFYLSLIVKSGFESEFNISDPTIEAAINASNWGDVPGTAGVWKAKFVDLSASVNLSQGYILKNDSTIFIMGTLNGGSTSGSRYAYFTDFVSQTYVTAGTDVTICANTSINLTGSVTGSVKTGRWTSTGSGLFSDIYNLYASYTPSPSDKANGSVVLTLTSTGVCTPVDDSFTLSFDAAPTVNANSNQTVCGNNADVQLNGSFTIAMGCNWSTNGDGGFDDPVLTNAVYSPGSADITNGTVRLYLTTTGNATCNAEVDSMDVTITVAPTIDAGIDQTVCSNNAVVTLNAITNGIPAGGQWTGGIGGYNPGSGALNTLYTPDVTEIVNTSLKLYVTTQGSTGCTEVKDSVVITFSPSPIVNAGVDQVKCENNAVTLLNGSVSGGATTGTWTNGLGTFVVDNNDLNASYSPTPSELIDGSVELYLTSSNHDANSCLSEKDTVLISFTTAPTVEAGPNKTVCANFSDVSLSGAITIASGAIWSTTGDGGFDNASSLTTIYHPSVNDNNAGSVKIYLTTTTGIGNCTTVKDSMIITITPAPTVNAGVDHSVCANNAAITLNATSTVATAWQWSGGANLTGWNPNSTALNTIYTPTQGEIDGGSVTLTLTTTTQGTCATVTDNITINFTAIPVVNAGVDQVKCENNSVTVLGGTVSGGATAGTWTNGLGTFVVDNNDLNASYTPAANELIFGSVKLYLTSSNHAASGCSAVKDSVVISFTPAPTVNAGGAEIFVCQNNAIVGLSGSIGLPATGATWTGGTGAFSNPSDLNATYTPTSIEITNANPIILTLTTTGSNTCTEVSDQIIVKFETSPVVVAGAPQTSCENNPSVTLQASIINATGGVWDRANSYFSTNNTDLLATFTPDATDITNHAASLTLTSTGNGSCNAESDMFQLTIVDAPIVNAGTDGTVCANNAVITLSGTVTNAGGGSWSGGLGSYGDANSLNTTYQPSSAEITNGTVTLFLTSTVNGTCNSVQDDVTFVITTAPTAFAGLDKTVCANSLEVNLTGILTIATQATWSGGLGIYNPDENTLITTYTPHASEILAQTVSLVLTTVDNGLCNAVTDTIDILIEASPIVEAGIDIHTCYNNSIAALSGTITNAIGGTWSGGSGGYNPSVTDLNADYSPSSAEITAGTVKLYLTSTGNGTCVSEIDSVRIIIDPKPIVDAGTDITVCANNADAVLNGYIDVATGGIWTGGLGVFDPSNTVLNATYTPTLDEINNGFADLILTTTGNDNCLSENDVVRVIYTTAPTADAGLDFEVCENNNQIDLNGIVTVATGGVWSGGLGTYNPDSISLITSYTPTAAEITNGSIILTLTTTGNSACLAVSNNVEITINPSPTVEAGNNIDVCVDNLSADLSGSVSGITNTGEWTTNGTGLFVPNNSTLNASYVCSSADSTLGTVTLILTSTNNDVCLSERDSLDLFIVPAGQVDAGTNETVCANNSVISLNGTISGGATVGTWSTNGSGVFLPNINTLNASYIPSAGDTLTGTVDLTITGNSCNLVQSTITITITPAPFVNAGSNQIVCVDDLDVQLDGTIYGATNTGIWTTNGTGTFDPDNTTLDAVYHASVSDSLNGFVTLYLDATNYGNCNHVNDSIRITISPAGVVDAGDQQTLCSNNSTISLNGSITGGATEGLWTSSGSGNFTPSATDLNATYTPSPADLISGSVTLVLTATNSCNFAFDAFDVQFTPSPSANAGNDTSLCANLSDLPLMGSYTVSTGALWSSTGTGSFAPSASDFNATYTPSAADINAGGVELLYTTTGNGACNSVTDTLAFEITLAPIVQTGQDQTVCNTATETQLFGYVSGGATSGIWTTVAGADGTFDNATNLSPIYTFGTADLAASSIQLALTSTNNDNCVAESDTITLTFGNTTFAYAGVDQTICGDNLLINLSGIVSGGTSTGTWTSGGTGTFVPNADNLNAGYICSSQDSLIGSVEFLLTTTNNAGCNAGVDTMNLTILPVPTIFAGNDIEVCIGVDSVAIAATAANVGGVQWATSGTGTFSPNDTSLSAYYIPSVVDSILGSLTLTIVSINSGLCSEVTDDVNISFTLPLSVNFGSTLACENQDIVFTDSTTVYAGVINSWYWEFGDGSVDNNQNPTHTYLAAGDYSVTLTVASSLGCSYTKTKTTTVYASPAAGFTYAANCYLDEVVFADTSIANEGTLVSWNWNFGDANTSTVQNPTHMFDNSGNYTVSLIIENSNNCTATVSQTVNVYAKPIADYTYSYNCTSGIVSFSDISSSDSSPINFWDWSFGDGSTSIEQNPDYSFATDGAQTVMLISGNSPNCSDTITQQVYLQSISADFNFISKCTYDSVAFNNLTHSYGDTVSTYLWVFGDGNTSNDKNPSHLYSVDDNYTVLLIAETNSGCTDSITKQVVTYPVPTADFDYTADKYEVDEIITFTDASVGANNWQWSFDDGITVSIQNPQHIYNVADSYTVIQSVSNEYGCVDTAETTLIIKDALFVYPPKLPTAFSPNNDGMNDVFIPRGGPFTSVEFRIYDSWGGEIFNTSKIDEGWDGTYKGIDQKIGIYVWTLKAVTIDGEEYIKKGDVTLIR